MEHSTNKLAPPTVDPPVTRVQWIVRNHEIKAALDGRAGGRWLARCALSRRPLLYGRRLVQERPAHGGQLYGRGPAERVRHAGDLDEAAVGEAAGVS